MKYLIVVRGKVECENQDADPNTKRTDRVIILEVEHIEQDSKVTPVSLARFTTPTYSPATGEEVLVLAKMNQRQFDLYVEKNRNPLGKFDPIIIKASRIWPSK